MSEERKLDCMPFGKHKGVPIEDVPYDYLRYVIDNFKSSEHPDIYEMVENEYIRRKNQSRR